MISNEKDVYELEELIEKLEKIKKGENEPINFPKSFYTLSCELQDLKDKTICQMAQQLESMQYYIDCLHKIIPKKYKKTFPKEGENPFFSSDDFKPQNPQEYEDVRTKMKEYADKFNEENPGIF